MHFWLVYLAFGAYAQGETPGDPALGRTIFESQCALCHGEGGGGGRGPNMTGALDGRTGRELWKWERPLPSDYQSIGFGRVNRGPAILDDRLYVATLDCYLVALDIHTGAERWSVRVEDYRSGAGRAGA